MGARYYDAQVGRFITRDTDLDQKPYLYCEHDPINAVDPDGHGPKWIKTAGSWIGEHSGALWKGISGAVAIVTGAVVVAKLYNLIAQALTDADEHFTMDRNFEGWCGNRNEHSYRHPFDKDGSELAIKDVIDGNYKKYLRDVSHLAGEAGQQIYSHP